MTRQRCRLVRLVWLVLPALLAIGLWLVVPSTVDAATITVTGTGNNQVGNDGICTLVEALNNTNSNQVNHPDCPPSGAFSAVDTIAFNIPSAQCPGGVCTILTEVAYQILGPTTIDGYTQPGASPNTLAVGTNATLRIVLQPQSASVTGALRIQANDVTVRGLVLSNYTANFSGAGIAVETGARARIIGCFIGTDVSGALDRGNSFGIDVQSPATDTRIGSASPADRNLISGNTQGIVLRGPNAVIQGNAIGTNAAGAAGLANDAMGIFLAANNATIGGVTPGEGNVIAFNGFDGIEASQGLGNRILGNAIFSNASLGIDLGVNGVTPNDGGDVDAGPNNYQNFPVLSSVGVRVNTTVHGTLNSTPNRQFRIEFFSNAACDSSGNGEGETYLGFVNTATTDGNGNLSFVWTHPQPISTTRYVTATATDLITNDTSEFSACFLAREARIQIYVFPGATTEANEGGAYDTLAAFAPISMPTANVTVPVSVSDPTEGRLVTPSTLTFTPSNGTTPQVAQLLGVDDGIDDETVPYALMIGSTSSADPNYNGLSPIALGTANIDNDSQAAQCGPRPKVNVSVAKTGTSQLRATVSLTANPGTQNELRSIAWTRFDTATVVLDGVGPVQVGQTSTFSTPLTQSASFVITRTPGASSGTVRLTITDACGAWPSFVGGGPRAW